MGGDMAMKINIFTGLNEVDNQKALEVLKPVPDAQLELVSAGGLLDDRVKLPFIETSDGVRHYGLRSIQGFVTGILKQS